MARAYTIEGFAIVSADGMIADAAGAFPYALRNDADRHFLRAALDRAAAVALGRISHHQVANSGRRRLVLTRSVRALAPDPSDAKAMLWNPAGAPFEAARLALGLRQGMLAVMGGTDVYALFLSVGYDAFHLSVANRVTIGDGYPLFPRIEGGAEDVLRAHGLKPGPVRLLDAAAGVTLVTWRRAALAG